MKRLSQLSHHVARWELRGAALMLAIVVLMLLINIFTRALGMAQYWVDETAITAMVWMTFLAASAGLSVRSNIAMTLIQDAVPHSLKKLMALLVDVAMLGFVSIFLVLVWRWFDLPGLSRHGFDVQRFAETTFNFIYEEPTQSLGIRKFWVWLVLPLFSVTSVLHCLACLQNSLADLLCANATAGRSGVKVKG